MIKLSDSTTNVKRVASDSDGIICDPSQNKRARHDNNVYTSKFKGVVALQNVYWGSQIYADHQWIWLGTFKSEDEAAKAYDSACIKLRNYSHRNFPWTTITSHEPDFQDKYSKEEVLCMIKNGSYPSKFADFVMTQYQFRDLEVGLNFPLQNQKGEYLCTRLFEKELTPSDVGKLNRLVIPKKHAMSYFPCMPIGLEGTESGVEVDDVQLVFYDRSRKPWKFRYCYWKSSQSYVFTRGWNEFVREKQLNCKDRIIFFTYSHIDGTNPIRKFCMIDVAHCSDEGPVEEMKVDFRENVFFGKEGFKKHRKQTADNELGSDEHDNAEHDDDDLEGEQSREADMVLTEFESADAKKKGFKLFGVQII